MLEIEAVSRLCTAGMRLHSIQYVFVLLEHQFTGRLIIEAHRHITVHVAGLQLNSPGGLLIEDGILGAAI